MIRPVSITNILSATVILWACQPLDSHLPSQTVASYDVRARPRAIATGDLNSDAALDVAVANSADGTVSILRGVGGGRLRPAASLPFPAGQEPSDVDAADLDRDGDVDLVFANHETSRVTFFSMTDEHVSQGPATRPLKPARDLMFTASRPPTSTAAGSVMWLLMC